MLNNDALLNIFYLYQLIVSESYSDVLIFPQWENASWWYKPVQVCRRWRYLILASPARLDLHLICTYGTPVADMLAYSPPFPLIINYLDYGLDPSTEDEDAILLALQCRDRVRRIGLSTPAPNLLKLMNGIDGQFPALERLFIWPRTKDDTSLMIPPTFQAPHLGMLSLSHAYLPLGSALLRTTVGLLTFLVLLDVPLSAYFQPSYLVAQLPFMPHLERLSIGFKSPIPTRRVERQPLHTLIEPCVTLPLRILYFRGVNAYLEQLLARINSPLLEVLQIHLFNQISLTFPYLLQFINRIERFKFSFSRLVFHREVVSLMAECWEGGLADPFHVAIDCRHVDWQLSAVAQIIDALAPILSTAEGLALRHQHGLSSEWHDEIDHTQWRNLLRPFSGVKVLYVAEGLIGQLSQSLRSEDGEQPLELFPELRELVYYKEGDASDAYTSFIAAHQIAGRSVILTHLPPPPSWLWAAWYKAPHYAQPGLL